MLRSNLTNELTYGHLREIVSSLQIIPRERSASLHWAEVLEEAIAEYTVNHQLASHHDNDIITHKDLARWQRILSKRWARVSGTRLAYPYNTQSFANQLYSALADFFQPLLNIPRFQLLMPNIESSSSSITMTDLAEHDLSLTDIVLSDDGKSFIEVKACLFAAVEDAELKHTQLLIDGKATLLSAPERRRVIHHHPEALELYNAIQKRHDFTRNGVSVGASLQRLIDGLRAGGVDRSRTVAEREINEMNATEAANVAILEFSHVYNSLSVERRAELDALKDDHHCFLYYWNNLALDQQKKIDDIKNNNSLDAFSRAAALRNVHASVVTCVQITAHGLEAILNKNREKLFSMCLSVDEKHGAVFVTELDHELLRLKRAVENKMALYANGLPYVAANLDADHQNELQRRVLLWLQQVGPASFKSVLLKALPLISFEYIQAFILPALKGMRRDAFMQILLPLLQQNIPVQIAAGQHETYYLNSSGKIAVYGIKNAEFYHREPENLLTELSNEKIIQIASGLNHLLCLTEKGVVYGCGNNNHAQLGFLSPQYLPSFEIIPGLPADTKIVKIMSHLNKSILISSDSEIFVMGDTKSDPFHFYHASNIVNHDIRKLEGMPDNAVIIQSSFSQHLLVLTSDGRAFGGGNTEFGQLGYKSDFDICGMVEIDGFPPGTKLTQVAAGNIHSLFLAEDGKVYGCGSNRRGQQGFSNHKNNPKPREITGFPEGDKVVQIAAGLYHSLFLTESGRVFVCGGNEYGQLGLGYCMNVDAVTEVTGLPPGKRITKLTASMEIDSCSYLTTDDGSVYGFGRNSHGHLGLTNSHYVMSPKPLSLFQVSRDLMQEIDRTLGNRPRHLHGRFFSKKREMVVEQPAMASVPRL